MKRAGNIFEGMTEFATLRDAFKRAFRGSGRTDEACRFCFNLERELLLLQDELRSGSYSASPYRYFTIFDPKERTISVAPFRDRVVHHAVVGAIEPIYERCFIYDSYATRKLKGTHRAIARAQAFTRRNQWHLKTDVEKYFDSIDHRILEEIIERKIKDRKLLVLIRHIIQNSDTSRGVAQGKGLPIGNLTSQFLANVYLDPLDHFLKEECRVRYYIRYMDDCALFSQSKESLKELLQRMKEFLSEKLGLGLKESATLINTTMHGLSFLGVRVFPNLIRIRSENLTRTKGRMKQRLRELKAGEISENRFVQSIQSMTAHMACADTLLLRRALLPSVAGGACEVAARLS